MVFSSQREEARFTYEVNVHVAKDGSYLIIWVVAMAKLSQLLLEGIEFDHSFSCRWISRVALNGGFFACPGSTK